MPNLLDLDRLPDLLKPGMTVFVQSSSSEPTALVNALAQRPDCCKGVHFISCQIPGLNRTDFAGLHPEASFTGLFVTPEITASYREGSVRFMPLSYRGMYHYLERQSIDLALIQVTSTEADGAFSLGTSVHFVPAVLDQAKTVIAEVNELLPCVDQSFAINTERLDHVVPVNHALPSLDAGAPSDVARKIGAFVAQLVRDGDHVQVGIGKVPSAVLEALHSHKRLSCYGGLIGDAMIDLEDAGAVDPEAVMVCTSVIGTKRVYDWVRDRKNVHVRPVCRTHDVRALAELKRLVAVNSVLAVDLSGQANAETVDGRQVGGCGGLPDFIRGAQLSDEGRSVLALPSTASRGKISRIVPHIGDDTVSCPRIDADFVVTEHGIADLGFKSLDERAEAMIAIADPKFRDQLSEDWRCQR
jgi:4-hydroxybutyrate CoA-transferase